MSECPINSTARKYKDQEGNDVTLRQLIKLEPEWAHSRILAGEEAAHAMSEKSVCEWQGQSGDDQGTYDTGCKNLFMITEGTAFENGFKFCPYCGGELYVSEADYSDL